MELTYSVLHSLHRPFHRPLWMVKWVCFFFAKRKALKSHFFYFEDVSVDFYFVLLEWLYNNYPKDCDGIPSQKAINNVYLKFQEISKAQKISFLKEILSKGKRIGIEKQIYSTYKASGYYLNLAKQKLHFVDSNGNSPVWKYSDFYGWKKLPIISRNDRKNYIRQILKYDACFFLSLCLLQNFSEKYGFKQDEIVFEFMQIYYPIPEFNYIHRSYQNYYDVRKHWARLLQAVTQRGSISSLLKGCIEEDEYTRLIYSEVLNNTVAFKKLLRTKYQFNQQKKKLLASYKKILSNQDKLNDYVNLYDLCSVMGMSYNRFNIFLSKFYEEERMKCNIFFINIVSTIDQRKRFYVRETPVLKIKIL